MEINNKNIEVIKALIKKDKEVSNSNVISIVADRGFGKTYLLNEIKKEKNLGNCYVLSSIVNPLKISSDYGIVEIILSKILEEIDSECPEQRFDKRFKNTKLDFDEDTKRELREKIDKIANKLITRKKEKDAYLYGGLETVEKIQDMDCLNKEIKNLIRLVLQAGCKEKLVVLIDDFDLIDLEILPQINNDILEFLMLDNLQLIVAYNQQQLLEVEINQLLNWYQQSIDKGVMTTETIKGIAQKKVEKIFPLEYKVTLPSLDGLLEMPANTYFGGDNQNLSDNIENYLINKIQKKLGVNIKSHNDNEMIRYILPVNLRGIIQLNDFLIDLDDNKNYNINIEKFKEVYLYGKIIEDIDSLKLKDIIINFRNTHNSVRNFKVIDDIVNYCNESKSNLSDIYYIKRWQEKRMRASNVSIANVYTILKEFNSLHIKDNYKLSYIIKLLYTLDLSLIMNKYKEEEDELKKETIYLKYKEIVNGEFIPMNPYNFFHKTNFPIFSLKEETTDVGKLKKYNLNSLVYFTKTGLSSLEYNTIFYDEMLEEFGKTLTRGKTRFPSEEKLYEIQINSKMLASRMKELLEEKTNLQNVDKSHMWLYNYFKFIIGREYIDYIIGSNDFKDGYIFKNMFDIEYFETVKYWRSSSKNSLHHMYKIFQNEAYNLQGVKEKINKSDLIIDGKYDYIKLFFKEKCKVTVEDIKDEDFIVTKGNLKESILEYSEEEVKKLRKDDLVRLLKKYEKEEGEEIKTEGTAEQLRKEAIRILREQ